MTTPIHVDLANPSMLEELADYLYSHGLAATTVSSNDHYELEVTDAVDPDERLQRTFEDALRGWLATSRLPLVPIASAGRSYLLRPPGD
jgi:hypothetical protein